MEAIMKLRSLLFAAIATAAAAPAAAAVPVYGNPGVVNPVVATFTAATTGDIVAYFAGASAGDTSLLGLLVNGVDTGITGLNNQTTAVGTALNFGAVTAGDSLVFYINNTGAGYSLFSTPGLNPDGLNHVFSALYAGDLVVPGGRFVAFEDRVGGDFDYNDLTYVFQNTAVPEPATWAMLILGFGLVGVASRRRNRAVLS
jgi:hypothetical protein